MSPPKRELSRIERLDWLRLIRTENVGPVTFRHLLTRFGSAASALAALPDLAHRGGRAQPLKVHPRSAAERELTELERLNGRLIALIEPDYPGALAALDDAPPVIAVLGQAQVLARPMVAIVGARNASANGRHFAGMLAQEIGNGGYTIASGLARGIDAAAHQAALPTGTVAVVAGGIDVIYPPENESLYRAIAERGAVVAEMHGAAGPPLPAPQPVDIGPVAGRRGRRGCVAVRQPYHRPIRPRARTRGLCRTRLTARPTLGWGKWSHP